MLWTRIQWLFFSLTVYYAVAGKSEIPLRELVRSWFGAGSELVRTR